MAVVNVKIGNRNYTLSCEDGEESHIRKLSEAVNTRVMEITESVGNNVSDSVILAMTTLMMQDEINELNANPGKSQSSEGGETPTSLSGGDSEAAVSEAIDAISQYIETVAQRIEKG